VRKLKLYVKFATSSFYVKVNDRRPEMPATDTIDERYEAFVRDLFESGQYASASEVIGEGLRLPEERANRRQAKLAAPLRDVKEGLDSGPCLPIDTDWIISEARAPMNEVHPATKHDA
jgi:antitoxin ParD1/3/4